MTQDVILRSVTNNSRILKTANSPLNPIAKTPLYQAET